MKIRKAVFPVAGLGTRFLPATKANPKEMMPIVDKPLIQYAVEEAIASGVQELIFVTSYSKRAIEDHFDTNYELESKLASRSDEALLQLVKNILPAGVSCVYVRQAEALGLGHAVLCAAPVIGNEPFAVLLADDLIEAKGKYCLQQMVEVYQQQSTNVIAVQNIKPAESKRYGVIKVAEQVGRVSRVSAIVEKPNPEAAPSQLGVVGRYILNPEIFALLAATKPGIGGEIQLTDALDLLLQEQVLHALEFAGKRYDCGSKLGYLQATVAYALSHPEIGEDFRAHLKMLQKENVE